MTEKILYILGAGASVEAYPLARSVFDDKFELKIPGLAHELRYFDFDLYFPDLKEEDNKKYVQKLKLQFKIIADQADKFGDVDTYAKYLHLKNPGGLDLLNLKEMLSAYFIFKQKFLDVRDKRYLSWLVSIMDRKQFPKNIKVLNWNYDFQLEMAGDSIGQLEGVSHSHSSFIYSPSWIGHFPNLDPTFREYEELSLVHLNGIAGYIKQNDIKKGSVYNDLLGNHIEDLLKFMQLNNLHSMIHFVWEKSGYHSELLEKMNTIINDSTILVVIGYSFPFFNREVDKRIFEQLKADNKLRKIYFQNPILNGQQLRAQFNIDNSIEIIHISQTENFHIPFEY
jgi:hypothetical protein